MLSSLASLEHLHRAKNCKQLQTIANKDSERLNKPLQDSNAASGIALASAHEFFSLRDEGMRRWQRRLNYTNCISRHPQSSIEMTSSMIAVAKIETRNAYIDMVLWQSTLLNLKCLFHHRQSILVPPECKVRVGEIGHCATCNK
jgi:hypothetical protein